MVLLKNFTRQRLFKVQKQNRDEYEPDTLTSMLRSFDRVLREQGKQS